MSGIINSVGSKSGVIGITELDYEEGSWLATTTVGSLYSDQGVCQYKKIGKQVTCTGYVRVNVGHADRMEINNMPFTNAGSITDNNNDAFGSCRLVDVNLAEGTDGGAGPGCYCIMRDVTILMSFNQMRDNTSSLAIPTTTAGFYGFTITYFTI